MDKNLYLNKDTMVLEFPIYLCVRSKNYLDTPPTKIVAFAVLTESLGVIIRPICKLNTTCNECNDLVMDLGECTTKETVIGKFGVSNESFVVQHFGFLDLPQALTIYPNYGFGSLKPMESKVFNVCFNPEAKDIPNYAMEGEKANHILRFRISITTIKNLGGIKKSTNYKRIRNHLKQIENELLKPPENELYREIRRLSEQLQNKDVLDELLKETSENCSVSGNDNAPETAESAVASSAGRNSSNLKQNTDNNSLDLLVDEQNFDTATSSKVTNIFEFFDIPEPTEIPENETIDNNSSQNENNTKNSVSTREDEDIKAKELWISAKIVDTLCEFSHQHVIFPETPCGSYSTMTIELRALKNLFDGDCSCGYLKRFSASRKTLDYSVKFQLIGGSTEIFVEPTCGTLNAGEIVKLTFVSKPEIPVQIVEDQAKALKVNEIREKKRLELEMKLLRQAENKKGKKDKKKKGGKDKKKKEKAQAKGGTKDTSKSKKRGKISATTSEQTETTEEADKPVQIPEIIVKDSEIHITCFDLYPAEMCVWRAMEPYDITANCMCILEYESEESIKRNQELLYLTAKCKVTRPSFITDLTTQHISFGPIAIGQCSKRIISIRNISYEPIAISASVLSPIGPFTCFNPQNLTLDPEYVLKIPITFTPTENKASKEYFEIKSGRTICSLILSGEGIEANITINPQFSVSRVEADPGSYADCSFEINNQCKAPIFVRFEKTVELEGKIEETSKNVEIETKTKKGAKESKKKGGKSKSPKGKSGKGAKSRPSNKVSNELTEDELNSLKNTFIPRTDATYFHVIGDENQEGISLEPFSKKNIKIRFGILPPPEEKADKKQKGKNKGKKSGKAKSKGSKSSKSNKSSKSKSSKGSKNIGKPEKYYLTKYNILLGNSTFLKDVIVIGAFK